MNAEQKIIRVISSLPPHFTKAINHFRSQRFKTWLTGGAIRDAIIGKTIIDIDLVVDIDPVMEASEYAKDNGLGFAILDDKRRIARIVGREPEGYTIDVALMQGTSIEEDLERRDFTMNAIALSWTGSPGKVIDPFNGIGDISKKLLRTLSYYTFIDDSIRILRAYRFWLTHNLTFTCETAHQMSSTKILLYADYGERVAAELGHILKSSNSHYAFSQMDKDGVLDCVFPEMTPLRGIGQNQWHHLDVFDHSMEVLSKLEDILRELPRWLTPFTEKIFASLDEEVSFGTTRKMALKLAALYHDTGKPKSRSVDQSGKVTFYGHENESAKCTREMCQRLRMPSALSSGLCLLVKNHLRPLNAISDGKISPRACYRYYRDLGDWAIAGLILCQADALATCGSKVTKTRRDQEKHAIIDLLKFIIKEENKPARQKSLITGSDLMERFQIDQGPLIGKLLEALREAVALNEVLSEKEAYKFIENILQSRQEDDKFINND